MARATRVMVGVSEPCAADLRATADTLGVSVASLVAGLAAWAARVEDAAPADVLPIELREAINEAARDAAERQADGAARGSATRGGQLAGRKTRRMV
jgi:hypothetical protein